MRIGRLRRRGLELVGEAAARGVRQHVVLEVEWLRPRVARLLDRGLMLERRDLTGPREQQASAVGIDRRRPVWVSGHS